MSEDEIHQQEETCRKYQALPLACPTNSTVGISRRVKEGRWPVHGMRIQPDHNANGWYIWEGEWSDDAEFFAPLHVYHLRNWCPQLIPYLRLPVGWRFLIAPEYEDVWFDAALVRAD